MPPRNPGETWENYVLRARILNLNAPITPAIMRSAVREMQQYWLVRGVPIEENDEWTQQAPPQKRDKEQEQRIIIARKKLNKEIDKRIESFPADNRGEKERMYVNFLRKKQESKLTSQEIVFAEIPIPLDNVAGAKIDAIRVMGYCTQVKPDHTFSCSVCNYSTGQTWPFFFCDGRLYCAEHVPVLQMCMICTSLRSDTQVLKTFDGRTINVCIGCSKSRRHCSQCGDKMSSPYIEVNRCETCVENAHDDEGTYRSFSWSMNWVSKNKGKIYKSDRMFSCELEAMSPKKDFPYLLNQELPKGTGIDRDGSVGVRDQSPWGFEVQTPRLLGLKGEECIEKTVAAIKKVDPVMDETCGMHVHLDGKGIIPIDRREYPEAAIQLLKSYVAFEDVIFSFLPYSRRDNDFCRRLSTVMQLSEFDLLDSMEDIERFWYKEETGRDIHASKGHQYHTTRYFGANFHSLFKEGHFEVRYHTGTLNRKKILEWANFHALILDACEKRIITSDFIREYQKSSRLSERTKILFEKIELSQSSQEWFFSRQKHFLEKQNQEEELIKTPKKKMGTRNITIRPGLIQQGWVVGADVATPRLNNIVAFEELERIINNEEADNPQN